MSEWYAVQTKPHKEFVVRDALVGVHSVQVYLPVLHVNPVNPRARKVRAFFPGYLFLCADWQQVGLSAIQWTPGLVRVLGSEGQPSSIPARVIDGIRSRLQEAQIEEARGGGLFRHGDRVRITTGPFEGFEGMFDMRLGGKTRVLILIEFLGRLTATQVDERCLEKASERRS